MNQPISFGDVASKMSEIHQNTITLRDHFAGLAMQAMISQCDGNNFDDFVIAEQAYQMADFMLKEREAVNEEGVEDENTGA